MVRDLMWVLLYVILRTCLDTGAFSKFSFKTIISADLADFYVVAKLM